MIRFLPPLLVAVCPLPGAAGLEFREHLIATELRGGYQVVAANMNGDPHLDLLALASGMPDLLWFENPGAGEDPWRRHTLAQGLRRMINLAACGGPGEPVTEVVVAHEFANQPQGSLGIVSRLRPGDDRETPWTLTEVDRLTTSHRLRCARIDGFADRVIVNAPLAGASSTAPDYRDQVPLVFYAPGEWKRRLVGSENEGVVHGIHVCDWDGDGRDEILTASFLGIHLYRRVAGGGWSRTELAQGDPSPWPKCGASDVTVGHLRSERFLASVEAWHGNQVVVYTLEGGKWRRRIIDDTAEQGHTIHAADLDGDSSDEIIAGFRGAVRGVRIYSAAGGIANAWRRRIVDDSIAASSCAVADLNGDGAPDIACIGSATANLKWYENRGKQ